MAARLKPTGTQFSAISEAHLYPDNLLATPSLLTFPADPTGQSSPPQFSVERWLYAH